VLTSIKTQTKAVYPYWLILFRCEQLLQLSHRLVLIPEVLRLLVIALESFGHKLGTVDTEGARIRGLVSNRHGAAEQKALRGQNIY
jgi:hypothetical protein